MQIILLEKIANLGNLGDVVKVKDGYARNFLIPTQAARAAPPKPRSRSSKPRRAELEKAAADKLAAAQALGEQAGGQDRAHQPEGRRRRPPVRLGHQRRHRRGADQDGLRDREVAGAPAQRSAEDGGRAHRVSVRRTPTWWSTSPSGGRRNRLTARRSSPHAKAGFGRPSSFAPASAPRLSTASPPRCPQACPQAHGAIAPMI